MKILVIGRKHDYAELKNGHSITFIDKGENPRCVNKVDNPTGIISLDEYDVVFQHLSPANPEAERAITYWKQKSWGMKLVGYSGGDRLPARYLGLEVPRIMNMGSAESFLALDWESIPADFDEGAEKLIALLQRGNLEYLPAFAILCQGYLAAHAKLPIDAQRWGISEAVEKMGWDPGKHGALVREDAADVRKVTWWLEIFNVGEANEAGVWRLIKEKWKQLRIKVDEEWGAFPAKKKDMDALLEELSGKQSLDKPELVAQAYIAIKERLESK